MGFKDLPFMQGINLRIIGLPEINDIAQIAGGLVGEEGRKIGKVIDDCTKSLTIEIDPQKIIDRIKV